MTGDEIEALRLRTDFYPAELATVTVPDLRGRGWRQVMVDLTQVERERGAVGQ